MSDEELSINLRTASETKKISVNKEGTVKDLRKVAAEAFSNTESKICLIFAGKILKDDESLQQHNIKNDLTIHVVIKSGGAESSSTAKPSQPTSRTNTGPSNTPPVGSSAGNPGAPAANPFAALMGGGGGLPNLGAAGGNLESMQASMQRELMNNPQMMSQMMENPMVQSIMSNPEIMRTMMQNNPQMRELMERNPEVGQMLNNPQTMRQMMELTRNPAMMQEMMRNYDRALSNLEAIPGGMNHLERMYRDVQEPLMDATTGGGLGGQNPFAALSNSRTSTTQQGTETNDPIPNPWAGGGGSVGGNRAPTATSNTAGANLFSQMLNRTVAPPATSSATSRNPMRDFMNQLLRNPQAMNNFMQSPYTETMLEQLQTNPSLLESSVMGNEEAFTNHPELRQQMRDMLPRLAEHARNPHFRSVLTNERALQALRQISENYAALFEEAPELVRNIDMFGVSSSTAANSATTGAPAGNVDMMNMMSELMRNMGSGGGGLPPVAPSANPEQQFATQLEQLNSMGFTNRQANIRALQATFGNVNAAIDYLLQHPF